MVAAAVKGLGLSVSAEKILSLPLSERCELSRWLLASAGTGTSIEQEMIRVLAHAITPARGRPPNKPLGVIEAKRAELTKPARGAPHNHPKAVREGFVRRIDDEIRVQKSRARGGHAGAVYAAVFSLAQRRRLDLAKVKNAIRRYNRWRTKP